MTDGELLMKRTEADTTRKIIILLEECKDLDEAKKKVRALLEQN